MTAIPPCMNVLTKTQTQCQGVLLVLMVLCFTMLKPTAMECCVHLMIHRKNSPVRFVLTRRYYFAKTIHANFGQHYVHAKAECIEFLLTVLDILLFDLNLVAYCTYNIQTAGYTPVHILRPCYQLNLHRNLQ